jgi:acyl carrier protein
MVLEDEFKSSIPDDDAAKFITVNDVVSFLKVHPGS